jgi:predicted transcriptional regulator
MAQIEVSEKLAAELKELAEQDDRAVEDVVGEAIHTYLSYRFLEPEFTGPQIEHMKHSLAQADRGEVISQDEIEAYFDAWEKKNASR